MAVRLAAAALLVAAAVAALFPEAPAWSLTKKGTVVSYDERSLMIDGKRDIFFSGAIHYPRSPPEAWPKLIKMAKKGGLNTIETYVFWNAHEPEPGKYNFEGRFDLVRFLKLVQEHDMYAIVRIGPFIQAEWNHGGLPFWLREVPNIIFRTNNEPFKIRQLCMMAAVEDRRRGSYGLAQRRLSGEGSAATVTAWIGRGLVEALR